MASRCQIYICDGAVEFNYVITGFQPAVYFFLKLYIGVQLINNVVLVSGVQQSDSVIHKCIYSFSKIFPM